MGIEDNSRVALLTYNNDNLLEIKLLQCGGYIAAEAAKRYIQARGGAATEGALKAEMEKHMSNDTEDPKKAQFMADPSKYLSERVKAHQELANTVQELYEDLIGDSCVDVIARDKCKKMYDLGMERIDRMWPKYKV